MDHSRWGKMPGGLDLAKSTLLRQSQCGLSGYSTRDKPHTDVADRLFARAMVLTSTEGNASALDARQTGKRSLVLVSIDSIAIVGKMTRRSKRSLVRVMESRAASL